MYVIGTRFTLMLFFFLLPFSYVLLFSFVELNSNSDKNMSTFFVCFTRYFLNTVCMRNNNSNLLCFRLKMQTHCQFYGARYIDNSCNLPIVNNIAYTQKFQLWLTRTDIFFSIVYSSLNSVFLLLLNDLPISIKKTKWHLQFALIKIRPISSIENLIFDLINSNI